jgi:hypothetical protein
MEDRAHKTMVQVKTDASAVGVDKDADNDEENDEENDDNGAGPIDVVDVLEVQGSTPTR